MTRAAPPRPQKSPCEKAGGSGFGWELTVKYIDDYSTNTTPWIWELWEDGKHRDCAWAASRTACIGNAQISKDRIIERREGRYEPNVITL